MTHRSLCDALARRFNASRLVPGPRCAPPLRRVLFRGVALAAWLLLVSVGPLWASCSPAGGWPGAPRAASPVGSVLDGLGLLGPLGRAEAALTEALAGPRSSAVPECAGGTPSSTHAEQRIDLVLPAVDTVTAIDAGGRVTGALERVSAGESLVLQFSRFYSSANAFSLSLGPGWSHSFDTRLARRRTHRAAGTSLPAAELQVLQADGRRITMQPVTRLTQDRVRYQGADLSDGVLEEDAAAPEHPWVWRWPSGRRLVFDTRGRLAQVEAPDLDRLDLAYDDQGRLVRVEDRHGRAIRLVLSGGATDRAGIARRPVDPLRL